MNGALSAERGKSASNGPQLDRGFSGFVGMHNNKVYAIGSLSMESAYIATLEKPTYDQT